MKTLPIPQSFLDDMECIVDGKPTRVISGDHVINIGNPDDEYMRITVLDPNDPGQPMTIKLPSIDVLAKLRAYYKENK